MDGVIEQILNVYGLAGVSVFMVFLIVLKFHSDFHQLFRKIFSKKMNVSLYSPKAILNSKLTYWREFKIDSLEMSDYGRTKIFRDFLHIKFEAYANKLTMIENHDDFDNIGRRDLYTKIVQCIHEITDDYETKTKAEGIPPIVIAKYKKWHSSAMDYTLKSAELITQSPMYKTNEDIMNAVYLLNISLLELTIAEAEKVLSDLNGELTGIVYKGYTIG